MFFKNTDRRNEVESFLGRCMQSDFNENSYLTIIAELTAEQAINYIIKQLLKFNSFEAAKRTSMKLGIINHQPGVNVTMGFTTS